MGGDRGGVVPSSSQVLLLLPIAPACCGGWDGVAVVVVVVVLYNRWHHRLVSEATELRSATVKVEEKKAGHQHLKSKTQPKSAKRRLVR